MKDQKSKRLAIHRLWLLLICTLLVSQISPDSVNAQRGVGSQVVIVEANPQQIVLELTVADFTIETVAQAGQTFQRIMIPGTVQTTTPGAPQTPSRGALLGLPTTVGVSVQVLASEVETLTETRLAPAPQLTVSDNNLGEMGDGAISEIFTLDAERYATDAFYPASPVQLGEVGYLRDQPVAQIQLYPVQFNPVRGEVRIYRRLLVQVTWDATAQAALAEARAASPVYENLLRHTLLNYAELVRPTAHVNVAATAVQPSASTASRSALPALKISVNADGLYQLTYLDLQNAGFNPATFDPRLLRLHNQGGELPLAVLGEEDGVFQPTDSILFYGTLVHDLYTRTNVYWLSIGSDPGLRMTIYDGTPLGAAIPQSFPTTLHLEEDTTYWQNMLSNGEDRWFWGTRLSPNTQDMPISRPYPVALHNTAAAGAATVRVRLKGYTGLAHRTRIKVNDQVVDDKMWHGQVEFTHEVSMPGAHLHNGDNEVRVETVDTGAVVDQVLVNWIEIDYQDRYVAEADQLWFGAPATGLQQFEIGGFTQPDPTVLDVTDPRNPVRIFNAATVPEGSKYKVKFQANAQVASRYLVLTAAQFQQPAALLLDQPSVWQSPANGADYIIITHASFYANALLLAEHRRSQGLRVAVVPVDDIYDEFNHGIFNPAAIRDFLRYAYQHWAAPAPVYVVLFGDANQDYKDNLHTDTPNYVPSQNIESELFGEVSSDDWFVAVSGDDPLPDLLIGRIAAQAPQEADAVVQKIIRYDQNPTGEAWNKNVLFVADDDETKFKMIAEDLAARLPYSYTVQRLYADQYPPGDLTAEIVDGINNGAVLVNYVGHGRYFGWGYWDRETRPIFENANVGRLNNANRLPLIIVANCLSGFFAGPSDKPALAEVLQRQPNGGALAVWAPTSLEYPTGHGILLNQLYSAIFVDDQQALGAATTAAKLATLAQSNFWHELTTTYVLLGDPATRLGTPVNYPCIRYTTPVHGATEVVLDQPIQIVFSKPMNPATVKLNHVSPVDMPFSLAWNADFTVLNLAHADFAHSQRYDLSLSGQDRFGNALAPGLAPNLWSFTVTRDDVMPEAMIEVQGEDSTAVFTTAVINLLFSEPVRAHSVTYAITPAVNGGLVWASNGRKAIFEHDRFQVGQTYTFTLLTATDGVGNKLLTPVQYSFTAGNTFYTQLPLVINRH